MSHISISRLESKTQLIEHIEIVEKEIKSFKFTRCRKVFPEKRIQDWDRKLTSFTQTKECGGFPAK